MATYIGGSSADLPRHAHLAQDGSLFLTGYTQSSDFPVANAFQEQKNSPDLGPDAVVLELDATGQLVFSSFLGGSDLDIGNGVAPAASGGYWVTGSTESDEGVDVGGGSDIGFPVTGDAAQATHAGERDGFLVRITSGQALGYASFLGGEGYEEAVSAVALDNDGVAVAGFTDSAAFPVSGDAWESECGEDGSPGCGITAFDGFLSVHDVGGGQLYGTYIGEGGNDQLTDVTAVRTFDAAQNGAEEYIVFGGVAGVGLDTFNARQPDNAGGVDGLVGILSRDGTAFDMEAVTYLGGLGTDILTTLDLDTWGTIFASGHTTSGAGFPLVRNLPRQSSGGDDLFIARLSPFDNFHEPQTGDEALIQQPWIPPNDPLMFSTLIAGSANDGQGRVSVDDGAPWVYDDSRAEIRVPATQIYVAASSESADFPVNTPVPGTTDNPGGNTNSGGFDMVSAGISLCHHTNNEPPPIATPPGGMKRWRLANSQPSTSCALRDWRLKQLRRDKPEDWSEAKFEQHLENARRNIDVRKAAPKRDIRPETKAAIELVKNKQVNKKLPNANFNTQINPNNGFLRHYNQYHPLDSYLKIKNFDFKEGIEHIKQFFAQQTDLFGFNQQSAQTITLSNIRSQHREVALERSSVEITEYIYLLQQMDRGIPIFDSDFVVKVTEEGHITEVTGNFYPSIPQPPSDPTLTPAEALEAMAPYMLAPPREIVAQEPIDPEHGVAGRKLTLAPRNGGRPEIRYMLLTWFPVGDTFRLAWWAPGHEPEIERLGPHMAVDAHTGEMLYHTDILHDPRCQSMGTPTDKKIFAGPRGQAFEPHPEASPPIVRPFHGDPLASPSGWLYSAPDPSALSGVRYYSLGGNNTCVSDRRLAAEYSNGSALWLVGAAFPGYSPFSADADFLFPFKNQYAQTGDRLDDDLDFTLTHVFYWMNQAHDHFYRLGFDEAAGNFQRDNFGRGGLGNDELHVHVHSGAVLPRFIDASPAFFNPTPDGQPPQLHLGLRSAGPARDAALDGDVLVHEYGHGVTSRLVGGPATPGLIAPTGEAYQSKIMAEGLSDYFTASLFNDPVIGEYFSGDSDTGLRNHVLSPNPLTFGEIGDPADRHDAGTFVGALLWDIRQLFKQSKLFSEPAQEADQVVIEALKRSAGTPLPDVIDFSEEIPEIIQTTSKYVPILPLVNRALACRGLGVNATTTGNNDMNPTENFEFEAGGITYTCDGLSIFLRDDTDPVNVGQSFVYTARVAHGRPDRDLGDPPGPPAENVTVSFTPPGPLLPVSATTDRGTCTVVPSDVSCDLGDVAMGGLVTIHAKVIVLGGASQVSAQMDAAGNEPVAGSNGKHTATETTDILCEDTDATAFSDSFEAISLD